MQKHFKKFIAAIFCIGFACAKVKDPYILSHVPTVQAMEKQDHQVCVSLKINFDKGDNLISKYYWHCRLSFAKFRLSPQPSSIQQEQMNLELNDLLTKISLKLADTSETILARENKKMDNRQHKQCLVMGYVVDTEDQAKIDEYFACRKALIDDQQLIPPYGNTDYLKYKNYSYNIGFVIDQKIERDLARYNAAKEKYPTCIKYNLSSQNFKNCTAAQDKSRECSGQIERKKFQKEGEEKITCQKQAYLTYNDKLLKSDELRLKEIERMNINSDYYNDQSFASLGIYDLSTFSDEKETAEEKAKKRKEEAKKINSKDGLYNKFELTKLRQKYIFSCQKEADEEVRLFIEDLKKYCENLANFEVIGEE